jgi:hypothetical protein
MRKCGVQGCNLQDAPQGREHRTAQKQATLLAFGEIGCRIRGCDWLMPIARTTHLFQSPPTTTTTTTTVEATEI